MRSASPVSVGDRYREVRQRTFGRPGLEWIVQQLLTGSDGIAYARLVCASEPTTQKTLAFAVLGDRHRFHRTHTEP
jgi:hypothetical protein